MNNEYCLLRVPAPCVPTLVLVDVDCETGAVAVSWEASHGAVLYNVVAHGNGGYSMMQDTNATTSVFDALPCGLNYTITVRAMNEACSSAESAPVQVHTGNPARRRTRPAPAPGSHRCTISRSFPVH